MPVENDFKLTIINSNAHSLCPKMNSLITCFDELSATFGVITETWLTDGKELEDDIVDLQGRAGLNMITKNRPLNAQGYSHGGVAVIFNEASTSFTELKLRNPESYEVLVATGRLVGFSRPVIIVACYIPPGYSTRYP